MRKIALVFAGLVALVIAALNHVDTRFPRELHSLDFSGTAAMPQQPPGGSQPAPATQPPAIVKQAPAPSISFSEPEIHPMWPGSKIARIVYGARHYVGMTVVSITAQTVVLRNEREIVSIPTGSLLADLRTMATAYLTGADGPPYVRLGSPALPALRRPPRRHRLQFRTPRRRDERKPQQQTKARSPGRPRASAPSGGCATSASGASPTPCHSWREPT